MPRRLTLLAALAGPLALALALAAPAGAGTYDVYSCWAGSDSFRNPAANASAWVKHSDPSGWYGAFDQCGSGTENGFGVISLSGYQAPDGTWGEVAFKSPSGTRVEHVRLWREAWSYGSGSGGDSQRGYLYTLAEGALTGRGDVFDGTSDVPEGMAGTTDTANHGLIPANQLDFDVSSSTPQTVSYRVGCRFANGCPTGDPRTNFASGVKIHGAVVTVRDSNEPELSVATTGLLTAGVHHGEELVHVAFARDDTGIKRLAVFADAGTSPVGVVDYERDPDKCAWWQPLPCHDVTDVDIPVDTHRVSDGDHRFVVRAYDAAENAHSFMSDPVTVKNGADARPDSFGSAVPIVRGPLNGAGATDTAALTAGFARRRGSAMVVRYGGRARLSGRLLNAAGEPIAGAEVQVGARYSARGPVGLVGSAHTGRDGRWSFSLRVRGPSRTVVVAYRSHVGDPDPTAARELRLRVAAGVRLHARPGRVSNGHAVTFVGSLAGRPLPRGGKVIEMQVLIGRRWRTFATVRAHGRRAAFTYRYRFTRTYARVTYRFRALARAEAAYPYATGWSRTVKVGVN